jgi:outer membrane scaffolding protein for murein synthesis (MipA/OmpV family)
MPGDELPRTLPPPNAPPPADWKWEGAIGPLVSVSPDYSGSGARRVSWTPGYYLRYGRISISNASGFVTRRSKDDVFRGLGLDLKRDDRLRLNAALRLDNGRRSSDAPGLAGIESVRRTIRARLSATYQLAPAWKMASGLNIDLLARGGGSVADFGVAHDRRWSPFTTWSLAAGVSAADGRHMRSYYGVNESESAASGHPVYVPRAGLRDVALGTSWRTEINERWVALYGASIGRLVGPAARSPLTSLAWQWSATGGVAWLF